MVLNGECKSVTIDVNTRHIVVDPGKLQGCSTNLRCCQLHVYKAKDKTKIAIYPFYETSPEGGVNFMVDGDITALAPGHTLIAEIICNGEVCGCFLIGIKQCGNVGDIYAEQAITNNCNTLPTSDAPCKEA